MDPSIFFTVILHGIFIGGLYALIGLSVTLIFGIMNIVNFAQGEFLMLCMYACYWICILTRIYPVFLFPITLLIGCLIGIISFKFVFDPLLHASHSAQLTTSLGLSMLLMNMALILWTSNYRSITVPWGGIKIATISISIPLLISFTIAMVSLIVLLLFIKKTFIGLALSATAQDMEAASLMGINIRRMYMLAFAISAGLTGLAGALLMQIYPVYPTMGAELCLLAYVIAVLGGLGSLTGAVVGSLIIGIVESVFSFLFIPKLARALAMLSFLLILYLMPRGLFKR